MATPLGEERDRTWRRHAVAPNDPVTSAVLARAAGAGSERVLVDPDRVRPLE
jgi:hypothetical protein